MANKYDRLRYDTNLPLSNGTKIVSVLQRLHGEIWRTVNSEIGRTVNFDVHKRDEQANRQTKNSTFLAAPAAGETRASPNLAQ